MKKNDASRAGKFARLVASTALVVACTGAMGATNLKYTALAGGPTGDGGQALAANLHGVTDVAVDGAGNLYVASLWSDRIRKIAPNGIITTIVGGNGFGYAGDGGPASKAKINQPDTLALDTLGNLYFADFNNRVRKVAANGTITTIAGNGKFEFSGDGGQAINASFGDITGLAVDKSGNVYVTDGPVGRVRKISTAGVITTIAGNGEGAHRYPDYYLNKRAIDVGFAWTAGVDVDANGNVWFGTNAGDVFRISPTGMLLHRMYTGSWAVWDIDVSTNSDTVYVGGDCFISKVPADTSGSITTYQGTDCKASPDGTPAPTANMMGIFGIAADAAGNIYGAETEAQRIIKIPASGPTYLTSVAGGIRQVASGQLGATSSMTYLIALTVDDANNVFFADWAYAFRIRRFTAGRVFPFAGNGDHIADCWLDCTTGAQAAFPRPQGLAMAPNGDVYISDSSMGMVFRIQRNGTMSHVTGTFDVAGKDGVPATDVRVSPRGIAVDGVGNLYIADMGGHRIHKVDGAGIIRTVAGNGEPYTGTADDTPARGAAVPFPNTLAVDPLGNVYFSDRTGVVRKVGLDGIVRKFAGVYANVEATGDPGIATNHRFTNGIVSMAVHSSGVWLLDGAILKRVRPNGRIETVPGLEGNAAAIAIKHNTLYVTASTGHLYSAPIPRIVPNDYNGDRRSDLFWRGSTGVNTIWLSADATTKQAAATLASENKLVAQGDFDGDGQTDLLWRNTINGNNIVWRSGNANTQMILTTMPDQAWQVAGVGDFNGDGKSDVYWRNNATGANQVWLGGNSLTKHPTSSITDMHWVVAGVGDFDADGKSDVLWRNTQTGSNTIWSGANASVRKFVSGVTNLAWKVAAIGDFNGDGVSDIAWRDTVIGTNAIWKSGNNQTPMPLSGIADQNWKIAAAGDYDNDGIDDVLWRNASTGASMLWKNAASASKVTLPALGSSWKPSPVEAQP